MKVEIHGRVHQKSKTGNNGSGMIGEIPRLFFNGEDFPIVPKKEDQKYEPAQSTDGSRLRESFRVIVMAMVDNEAVIYSFVEGKFFLKSPQAGPENRMIAKNMQG